MKTIDMKQAQQPLSKFIEEARNGPVVIKSRGRAKAAVVNLANLDWESFLLASSPDFLALIEQSRQRHERQGGRSLEQVAAKYGLKLKKPPVR